MTATSSQSQVFSAVDFAIEFEAGNLSESEVIDGFQELINSGRAWKLQGAYGRTAQALIDSGSCTRPPSEGKQSPELDEVRSSGAGQGTLPDVGPYSFVSRDTVRTVGTQQFRIVVYGAYNALGLVGSESNGVAVLQEEPPAVIADEIGCESSGYSGPSAAQLAIFEELRTCDATVFRAAVNTAPRLRKSI